MMENIKKSKEELCGEYTLAEILVDAESQLTLNELQPGATVLASNVGSNNSDIVSHEGLSKIFSSAPSASIQMPTEVVVQRTLADPALKQILQKADGELGFDPAAEQLKIRDFLAGVGNTKMTTEESVFQATQRPAGTSSAHRHIKCRHCSGVYDALFFPNHLCEGHAVRKYVEPTNLQQDKHPATPSSPPPPAKPASERLIMENQIRLRRYMKEEFKYDLTTGTDNSRCKKSSKEPNECTMCDRKFVHASGLVRHMEKHALDLIPSQVNVQLHATPPAAPGLHLVLKCNACGRIFYDVKLALDHALVHYPKQPELSEASVVDIEPSVDLDQLLPEGEQLLASLLQDNHADDAQLESDMFTTLILGSVLQCEFCDYNFAGISELLLHSSTHAPERRLECTTCDITMRTAKEASVHFQNDCTFMREGLKQLNVSLDRYFVCNVCEQKFTSTELLQEHRYCYHHYFPRLSEDRKRLLLSCDFCDVNFEFAHEIQTHNEEKHTNKKKREKEHRNTSAGRLRQYLCDICGKSYTQSSHLWQHLRFHQGVKPFVCTEENCGRKFTIRPDLNDHIRKCHTGERPYHCQVCGKRFLTGSVFYQHRLIHRGERRYECEECGKRFYRADALKNHQRIHTGEKPYSCLFCTKTFRQRGDRDKHIRARHAHLDANSRLMMQMQKFQLESAAAAAMKPKKTNGHPTSVGDSDVSVTKADVSADAPEYPIMSEQPESVVSLPIDELESNSFLVTQYVEVEPDQQQVIVYQEQDEQEMPDNLHMLSLFEAGPEQVGVQLGASMPLLDNGDNPKVVVVKTNASQSMYSDSYM